MTMYFDYLNDELANTANKIIDALMGSNVEARNWAYEQFQILLDEDLARVIVSLKAEITDLKRELDYARQDYNDLLSNTTYEIRGYNDELQDAYHRISELEREIGSRY